MRQIQLAICSAILLLAVSSTRSWAQPTMATANVAATTVPHLMKFSGSVKDGSGKPVTGVAGLTFALYKDQEGGAARWIETQNVQLDSSGRYSITLGSTKTNGLPSDLFVSGEARWMGVQPEGQAEQPRVLLLSVPYALKAADAETIGGLPPSAFVLATPGTTPAAGAAAGGNTQVEAPTGTITGTGTANYVPLWTSPSNIANSVLYQSGSGGSAKLGINLTTPSATLDVNGTLIARGTLQLHSLGTATPSSGFNSNPVLFTASSFNSSKGKAISENFQWQAEPVGNDTPSASGTLNLLFGASGTPTETGLNIGSTGVINFAPGQTFPGAGTITGVTAGTDLTGGGTGGSVTLNLDTTKVPQLNAANIFSGNQSVNGNLTIAGTLNGQTGSFSGSSGFGTAILSAVQKGNATAVLGFAAGTTGFNVGVSGLSSSSSGIGVSGEGGTGVWGTGYIVGGQFQAGLSSALVLQGLSSGGASIFSVDGRGNLSTTGTLNAGPGASVAGNGLATLIGDPGCGGSGTTAIGFSNSGLSGCSNYALRGDTGGNLYINSSSTGWMFFNHNNNGTMSLDPSGNLGVQGNASQARAGAGLVKAMAYVDPFVSGGIAVVSCYNSQMTGSAITTPPCGIAINHYFQGVNILDFGFQVNDRFIQVTPKVTGAAVTAAGGDTFSFGAAVCDACALVNLSVNQVEVLTFNTSNNNAQLDVPFFILVY